MSRSRSPTPDLRSLGETLAGVRGLLLDLDGVIVSAGRPIDGSAAAIGRLERRGFPYRIVTNTSMASRASLARWATSLGAPIPAERFHSALTAAAAETARRHAGRPLYVLASEDAKREFTGQHLLTAAQADAPGTTAAAVVIGDDPDSATWENLNRAFRLVRRGAELIGMHRNRWWLTPAGETLDSGAFVTGLAFAAEVRPRIAGKPSPTFFRSVARELTAEIDAAAGSPGRARRAELAMVGDDIETDVLAARRAGLRGILVLTGKHGPADVARVAARRRGGGQPDAIATSLAEVVAALD
jgi:HAD superfamily hydrolase (TIGR01458 family)